MPKGWEDTKPSTNQSRWEDALDWYKYKSVKDQEDDYFNHIRLVGPIMSAAHHWVEITKQDGKKTAFPMTCAGYDPETELITEEKCPACIAKIRVNKFYFQNAIIRQLQEDKPAKAKNIEQYPEEMARSYREVGDQHWSPIKVVKIPVSCASQLRDIVKLNRHKIQGSLVRKDISDPKYGLDVFIKFDGDEAPANMYNAQKGDASSLTKEEQSYKLFNLDVIKVNVENNEKSLLRLGYLKPSQARFTKVEDDAPEDNLDIDDDEELPPAPEDEFTEDEEQNTDKFTSMDRKQLKIYNKKHNLEVRVTKKMSDEDLRVAIRFAESTKDSDAKKSCFGQYEGAAKCFKCNKRVKCVEKSE